MADMLKFYKGLVDKLPVAGDNGALYITTDEGGIYLGTGTGMKRLGDFVQVDNVAALPTKAHEHCLYYCVAENILAKWNGAEWKQINKQPTAEEMKTLLGLGSAAYTDADAYDVAGAAKAVSDYVGAIPEGYTEATVIAYINKKAEETLNAASGGSSESAASVLAALNTYKAENNAKVDANTDAIAAIKDGTSVDSFADVEAELAKKVDKVEGKSLLSDTEIARLAAMSTGANKVEASETNGNIKIDGVETVVYTHPATHTVSEISDFDVKVKEYGYATQAAVDAKIGEVPEDKTVIQMIADAKAEATYNDTQVKADIKANADAIDAIEADYLKAADKKELQDQITTNANAIERLTNGVSAEEVDGVNDLIQYVKDHGTEVTGIKADIAENAKAIADHETLAAETYETKDDASAKLTEAKGYAEEKATAAQTAAEAKVTELANGAVATNTAAIADLTAQLTWGEFPIA